LSLDGARFLTAHSLSARSFAYLFACSFPGLPCHGWAHLPCSRVRCCSTAAEWFSRWQQFQPL